MSQDYPLHASLPAATVAKASGKILSISGDATRGKDVVIVYNMQCRLM